MTSSAHGRPRLYPLSNEIKPYAWGSSTTIQDLLGLPADGTPAAELWLGAHPAGPSTVLDPAGGAPTQLSALVEAAPEELLGGSSLARFGPKLSFLLKVLAADKPLSIQAHPTLEQARVGYAAEDAEGIDLGAPERNYADVNHKPELIAALSPFEALCGFRPVSASAELLRLLLAAGAEKLQGAAERIVSEGGLRELVTSLLTMPSRVQAELVDAVVPAAAVVAAAGGPFAAECAETAGLAKAFPGDPGVVLALLMNLVHLEEGEALFLSAGRIHAYLRGAGVELMASSDNVLRCGLTTKHIDPPELLRVLDFSTEVVAPISPGVDGAWARYPVPVEDFRLSRLKLEGSDGDADLTMDGPQILLVTAGRVSLTAQGDCLELMRGASAFIPAGTVVRASGAGDLFQASTNLGI